MSTNLSDYTNVNLKVIKICENLWNLWANNLKQQMNLPQIAQINTDIGCGGVSHR